MFFQWYAELLYVIADMLDFSFFVHPRFLLFALSNFLLYTWYDVPYMYLADDAIKRGFGETGASIMISVIGIFNMGGEVWLFNISVIFYLFKLCYLRKLLHFLFM